MRLAAMSPTQRGVTKAFERVLATGPIDVLVNSAGISHVGNIFNTAEIDFDRLFRVNVKGTYLCMQSAVQAMREAGGGVILNMASIAATSGLSDRVRVFDDQGCGPVDDTLGGA